MPPKSLRLAPLLAICLLFCEGASAQTAERKASFRGEPVRSALVNAATEKRVEALLKQMTLEEKVGQLVDYSVGTPTGPGTGRSGYEEMIGQGQVGSLFNLPDVQAANRYQHIAVEKSRLHIPLIYGLDVIHGYRTVYPVPLGLSATWDPEIVERASRMAAEEASAAGVKWVFSPMVDIARDPRWGRIIEGAGEDPYLGSVLARAYVRGYQGKSLSAADSVAACPKHFVGYGAAEAGRDYNTTEISEHTLREVYLPPFHAALDEGAVTIMSGFNALNGVPATANPFTLTEILRREWKFPGLAVSDWTSVGELIPHGIANDGATASRKALNAGLDMDMESSLYHEHLVDEVKTGRVSQADVDEAVRHVLRVKFALGLFEKPYTDESRENKGAISAENLKTAREAAERSLVLLKNENHALPLSKDVRSVALIGPMADDANQMLGSWAGRGRPEDVVTLRAALTERLGAGRVKYAKGAEFASATDAEIADAVAAAQSTDVAILALGEDAPQMTAEAGSRAHLGLPGRQEELLEKVAATGKPVVLILFSGRPLLINWAFEHSAAVMEAWFPGVQAGPALTRVLMGDVAPSGRLTISWPDAMGQIPVYYNALNTGRPVPPDVDLTRPPNTIHEKFASRYIDEPNAPRFPFGFGLSYTEFQYSTPEISSNSLNARTLDEALRAGKAAGRGALTVSVNVTNAGAVAADEVVQLYVGLRGTSVEEPIKSLKGFQRVSLAAGETRKVTFSLGPEAFALWDIRNNFTVEPAKVRIWVNHDSAHGTPAEMDITE